MNLPQSLLFCMSVCLGLDVVPDKILVVRPFLFARYHIYVRSRRGYTSTTTGFYTALWQAREIENNIAKKTGELQKFYEKWDILKHGASLYLKFEGLNLSVVISFKTFHWLKNFESCSVVSVARRQCCFASEK